MAICDVLIIGSGIAGLSLALKLSNQFPDKRIYLVTKGDEIESNTRHAQGGISVVCDMIHDSIAKHIDDTLRAGDGLCDKEIVEKVVRYGSQALMELAANGVDFDREEDGAFALGREGGHSEQRIVHYKDMTGLQIMISLLVKVKMTPGIVLRPHHTVIDLITNCQLTDERVDADDCYGAFVLDNKSRMVEKVLSRVTVLATGGIGQVYRSNTNPTVSTGDGIAVAHRAGVVIRNMEFVQFHPTAFFLDNGDTHRLLVSEALRGYGAYLRNNDGNRFLFHYHPLGEMACRDVVARAIEEEIGRKGHPCVYLDCRHLPIEDLKKSFPTIVAWCELKGIDVTRDQIPVIPAAHYLCGGIDVDGYARTSLKNLYALGECAHTGLHGANRLASNSLLEALAFSEFCFRDICKVLPSIAINASALEISDHYKVLEEASEGLAVLRKKIQNLMTRHVGISRTTKGLNYALGYLELIEVRLNEFCESNTVSVELCELRSLLVTAKLIVIHSLNRNTNKGTFYNKDLAMYEYFELGHRRRSA